MTQQEWKDLVHNQIDSGSIDGQMMRCLAQIPDLMHRGRNALRSGSLLPEALLAIREEVRSLHDSFTPVLGSLRERWLHTDDSIAVQYPDFKAHKAIIHSHYSRSYGLALALGIIFNCMLSTLEVSNESFTTDSEELADEVITLGVVVDQYRPLGTVYMVLCLAAAWVGTKSESKKVALEMHLTAYIRDLQGPSAKPAVSLTFLEKRFSMM